MKKGDKFECPFCGLEHYICEEEVEEIDLKTNNKVKYNELFIVCTETEEEFMSKKMLSENLKRFKKAVKNVK